VDSQSLPCSSDTVVSPSTWNCSDNAANANRNARRVESETRNARSGPLEKKRKAPIVLGRDWLRSD
jgi:hypothetical protein